MRIVRGMSQPLCIVLLLFTCSALSAQNPAQKEEQRVRNIVLVHGAWVDGSGWKPVYAILTKHGYNVTMVQIPETSFQDDVAATKRILSRQNGPCILVGHSYGGSIITERPASTRMSSAWCTSLRLHLLSDTTKQKTRARRPVNWPRQKERSWLPPTASPSSTPRSSPTSSPPICRASGLYSSRILRSWRQPRSSTRC